MRLSPADLKPRRVSIIPSRHGPSHPFNFAFVCWDTMEEAKAAYAKVGSHIVIGASRGALRGPFSTADVHMWYLLLLAVRAGRGFVWCGCAASATRGVPQWVVSLGGLVGLAKTSHASVIALAGAAQVVVVVWLVLLLLLLSWCCCSGAPLLPPLLPLMLSLSRSLTLSVVFVVFVLATLLQKTKWWV